jgi:hypothetical protein
LKRGERGDVPCDERWNRFVDLGNVLEVPKWAVLARELKPIRVREVRRELDGRRDLGRLTAAE